MGTRILIVGFGNTLMGDDGAGPAVVERLRQMHLPFGVRVEDGGSDSLLLAGLWRGESEIWIVDAIRGGGSAGSVVRLAGDQVRAMNQRHATVHALSLPESLRWLALAYPEMADATVRFWGIEVADVGLREGLSEAVELAVGLVVDEVHLAAVESAG